MKTNKPPVKICTLLEEAAHKWPDKPAVTFNGRTQTWAETMQRCHSLASLLKRVGVARGDRVAYLGFNSNVLFESYYAPALIGAILVPVNYRLSLPEMIECVEDCTPKVLIVDPHFIAQSLAMRAACTSISSLIYAGREGSDMQTPEGMLGYEETLKEFRDAESLCELAPSEDDETVIIFYTGGTTGRAKGVMLSNINFQCNTDCSIALYRMQEHWKFIVLGPLFHLAAGSRVFSSTALGGHCVILPKFDVLEVFQAIQQYRINSATLVPTMFQMMLDHPEFSNYDLSSLKMLAYGAAPMSVALLRRVIKAFPGVEIFQTFGMTEASPIVTSLDSKYHVLEGPNANKLGSVGRAVSHVEVKIVDEDGNAKNAGETGEIFARGDNIMTGYWRLPMETAAALEGGWYHTGDAGYLDEDGFLFLEGRVKDMIVSGGENIYPIEVENVLSHHPSVHQCAVIGIPHERWGEAVHGVVVLKTHAQASEDELIKFCKDRIASYKCPLSVSFRDEPMPLSPINKILKTELRKPFWAGRKSKLI